MSDPETRLTPYTLVFDAPTFHDDFFPRIANDERTYGRAHDPAQLIALESGEALLQAVLPADALGPAAAPGRAPGGASAFVVDRYSALLFAAYRFWGADRPEYRFDEAATRALLEHPPGIGEWSLAQAPPAGYVVLPKNLVWSQVEDADAPEPVDGFFWVRTEGDEPQLVVVLALGMREGRPGFSVLDVAAPIPETGNFAAASDEGDDFANFLPGGELQHLFGVQTPAAALRLASLLLWHITVHADAVAGGGRVHDIGRIDVDG